MKPDNPCPICGAEVKAGGLCAACALGDAFAEAGATGIDSLGSISGHELIEVIARGGMGIVYRARQSDPLREVALKALPGAELISEEARQRFRIEAQAMARLQHPAIVPIFELGEEDGTPFFTMKLAAGGCLAQRIGDFKGKWREIAELIATIAEAVHYAHERGVLHRDLKPGNVLFDEGGQALVSDFGLAKIIGEEADLTRTIALMGTPNYMAPELTRGGKGAATTACDVWSLGVMLYELLAGQQPFRGDNLATILRQLNEEEPELLPREVPHDLSVIVGKALQKNPARRFTSAQELAEDLRRWLRGDAILARSQPLAEQCWRWLRRHPMWAAVFLLVLGGIALLVWSEEVQRHRNAELRQALSGALVEHAAAKRREAYLGRRPLLTGILKQAAEQAPSTRARTVAASLLSLPDAEVIGKKMYYRPKTSPGETVIPTADLQRRLTYRNMDAKHTHRRISLTAVDAPVENAEELWHLDLPGSSSLSADLTDSGRWVVFANGSKTELWDTVDNKQLGVLEPGAPTVGKTWLVDLHSIEPLLTWVEKDGALWSWRFPQEERRQVTKLTAPAIGIVASPSGEEIAISTGVGVDVWKVREGTLAYSVVSPGAARFMHWSQRGGLLVPHASLPEVAVIREQKVVTTFRAEAGRIVALTSQPNSWTAISLTSDNNASLWDMRDGKLALRVGAGPDALKAGADGSSFILARADDMMHRYRLLTHPAFREYDCPSDLSGKGGDSIEVSSDGRLVATRLNDHIFLWDTRTHRLATDWQPEAGKVGANAVFAPDGRALFGGSIYGEGIYRRGITWEGEVLKLGEPVLIPGTKGWLIQQIDPTGTRYALRQRGRLSLWEGTSAGPVRQITQVGHKSDYRHMSPRFTYGYPSSSYSQLRLYDGFTNKIGRELTFKSWAGIPLFSQDEQWMVAYSREHFRLLSTADWKERFDVLCRVPGNQFGHLAISPDSRLVALERHTDTFGILTIPDGQHLLDLQALPYNDVRAAKFSADGRKLLLLNRDHRLHEWDLDELQSELGKMGLAWPPPTTKP